MAVVQHYSGHFNNNIKLPPTKNCKKQLLVSIKQHLKYCPMFTTPVTCDNPASRQYSRLVSFHIFSCGAMTETVFYLYTVVHRKVTVNSCQV